MNIEILSVTSKDGQNLDFDGSLYDGFTGLYAFVDNIAIGEILNFRHILYKYSLFVHVKVFDHSVDEQTRIHTLITNDGIIKFKELDYKENKRKRFNSTLYMGSRLGKRSFEIPKEQNRYLYSNGIYPTKIYASDLPPWYIYGYIYKRHGYISAKGVKHLYYKPNYIFNHYLKYDYLLVSYDEEIKPIETTYNFSWYEGYAHILSGGIIVDFIEAVKKYSDYDVSEIEAELERKKDWFNRLEDKN